MHPSQIEKFRRWIEIGKADVKNISLSPYVLEEFIDAYEQLKEKLAEEDKLKRKAYDLKKKYSTVKDVVAARDEALIKIGAELKLYKHKFEKLNSRLGIPFKKGHWIITDNQVMCDICHGVTFLGDLDEELPYNFCPNCGIKMERMKK